MKFFTLTFFVVSSFFASVSSASNIGKIVGQLGLTEGEVYVDSVQVKKHAPIREGSIVEVKDGKTTLLLGSGSVFHLAANSKMVVGEFGLNPVSKKEGGSVNLRFGRTRALIRNKGDETKDVRIQTRTATMGVRGTEIFVNAPKDETSPVQFFTLEGKAVVEVPKGPALDVKQDQGVFAEKSGEAPGGVKTGEAFDSLDKVKDEIKDNKLELTKMNTAEDVSKFKGEYNHDPSLLIPFPRFDPIQDRLGILGVNPVFCNATSGCP